MLSTLEWYKTKYLDPLLAKYHMLKANDASHCRNWRLKEKKKNLSKWEILTYQKLSVSESDHKAMQNKFKNHITRQSQTVLLFLTKHFKA